MIQITKTLRAAQDEELDRIFRLWNAMLWAPTPEGQERTAVMSWRENLLRTSLPAGEEHSPQVPAPESFAGRRRISAVSQVLRRIEAEGTISGGLPRSGKEGSLGLQYRISVANRLLLRERVFRLAYAVYREQGYVEENPSEWMVKSLDARSDTFLLLAEDDKGDSAGTVTLYFDQEGGVPADAEYSVELAALRAQGRKIAEVSRLVMSATHRQSKELLVRLFNHIYIHARKLMGSTDFIVQVHPRHAPFYQRKLGFEIIGDERPCTQVKGSPAVLLRLDLALPERMIAEVGGGRKQAGPGPERTLYPYFLPLSEELEVARHFRRAVRPMSEMERIYFNLQERVAAQ